MRWIRLQPRLAIYLRDKLTCTWCGESVHDGAELTLDHCKPRSKHGGNEPSNLVTSCVSCNSRRGDKSLSSFSKIAAKHNVIQTTPQNVLSRVTSSRRRSLDKHLAQAKRLLLHPSVAETAMLSAIVSITQ
jgi:hypothetical protein